MLLFLTAIESAQDSDVHFTFPDDVPNSAFSVLPGWQLDFKRNKQALTKSLAKLLESKVLTFEDKISIVNHLAFENLNNNAKVKCPVVQNLYNLLIRRNIFDMICKTQSPGSRTIEFLVGIFQKKNDFLDNNFAFEEYFNILCEAFEKLKQTLEKNKAKYACKSQNVSLFVNDVNNMQKLIDMFIQIDYLLRSCIFEVVRICNKQNVLISQIEEDLDLNIFFKKYYDHRFTKSLETQLLHYDDICQKLFNMLGNAYLSYAGLYDVIQNHKIVSCVNVLRLMMRFLIDIRNYENKKSWFSMFFKKKNDIFKTSAALTSYLILCNHKNKKFYYNDLLEIYFSDENIRFWKENSILRSIFGIEGISFVARTNLFRKYSLYLRKFVLKGTDNNEKHDLEEFHNQLDKHKSITEMLFSDSDTEKMAINKIIEEYKAKIVILDKNSLLKDTETEVEESDNDFYQDNCNQNLQDCDCNQNLQDNCNQNYQDDDLKGLTIRNVSIKIVAALKFSFYWLLSLIF